MKTLKDLKDALNKLPDEEIDKFFITHKLWMEEPEDELGVVWCGDEEDELRLNAVFKMEGFEVIKQFVRDLQIDAEKVFSCRCRQELIEDETFLEDFPEKG